MYFTQLLQNQLTEPRLVRESELLSGVDNNDEQLIDRRFPNTLTFGKEGNMYIGDSRGDVHIWNLKYHFNNIELQPIKSFSDKEISGDPINTILIPNIMANRILLHSRDNCIREVNLEK